MALSLPTHDHGNPQARSKAPAGPLVSLPGHQQHVLDALPVVLVGRDNYPEFVQCGLTRLESST